MPKENKNADARQKQNKNPPIPNTPYVRAVLELYRRLPHTPHRPRRDDRFVVRQLELQRHPILRVQAALILATVRRLFRDDNTEHLMPIRSFRYFLPIVDELRINGLDPRYVHYLARKISDLTGVELNLKQPQNHSTSTKPHTPRQLDLPW